jgi:hypothetical protein
MDENLAMWTELNGCTGAAMVEWFPDIEDEGTRAWRETYDNCDAGDDRGLLAALKIGERAEEVAQAP